MKIIVVAVVLGFSFVVNATGLEACRYSCSSDCRRAISDMKLELARVEQSCNPTAPPEYEDIIKACDDSFTSSADEKACMRSARSASAVYACEKGFFSTADELSCAMAAANGEAVEACIDGFFSTVDELSCAKRASSAGIVKGCLSHFTSTEDELACIR